MKSNKPAKAVKKSNKNKAAQSRSLLLNSANLSLWLAIVFFLVTNMGPWTKPSIANHMFIKAIWAQLSLSLLLFLFLWQFRNTIREWVFSLPRVFFLALFCWASLTFFWATDKHFFVFKWLMWFSAAIMFYLTLQIEHKDIKRILNGIIYSALGVCVLAFAQMYFGYNQVPQVIVPAATFGNKNMLGQLMILVAPICVYLFAAEKNNNKIWFYAIAYACIVVILYHSVARATWISYFVGLVVLALFFIFDKKNITQWLHWTPIKTKAVFASLAIVLVLVNFRHDFKFEPVYDVLGQRITSVVDQATSYGTEQSASRYNIWRATINEIKDKPILGHGLGGFFSGMISGYKNNKSMRTFRAHNDYLETWAETGLVGFLLMLAALFSVFYCTILLLRKTTGTNRLLYIALFTGGGSSLINAFFSFPFQLTVPLIIACCYAAFIIKGAEEHGLKRKLIAGSTVKSQTFLGIASIGLVFSWLVNFDWWNGYVHVDRSIKTINEPYKTETVIFNQEQVPILWAVGSSLNRTKSYQKSLYMMAPLIERWPNDFSTLDLHFDAYVALKRYKEAIEVGERALNATNQGLFGMYKKLFELYTALGQKDKARSVYERLVKVPQKDLLLTVSGYEFMILLAMRLGLDTPPQHYSDAAANRKSTSDMENNMVIYYISKKQRDKALEHIDRLHERAPNHINMKTFLMYKENPDMNLTFSL